jgi:hypothetical protein
VDWIVDPSGRRAVRGELVGFLLMHGTFIPLKCPVDPVSAIAIWCGENLECCLLCCYLLLNYCIF